MIRHTLSTCVLLALSSHLAAQSQVWVVDDDAGPGVDFADIQPAIDAAVATDVVLVRAGNYTPFTLAGKGLSIVSDDGDTVVVEGVGAGLTSVVSGIPAGQRAVIRGLTFQPPMDPDGDLVRLESSAGLIWLEDVELETVVPFPFTFFMNQVQAMRVQDCARVVMTRTNLRGLSGASQGFGLETGSRAMTAENSTLHLFDCTAAPGPTLVLGDIGREGILVENCLLSLRACTVTGGAGGGGSIFVVATPGPGGPGVEAVLGSEVYSIGSTVVGGPGGTDFLSGEQAPSGPPFLISGDSTLVEHAATNVAFDTPAVASDATKKKLDFLVTTDPGSTVLLLATFETDPVFLSVFPDAVATGLDPLILNLGTTDGSGSFGFVFGTPFLPASIESFDYTLQVAVITPTTGIELSNPSIVTLVQDDI